MDEKHPLRIEPDRERCRQRRDTSGGSKPRSIVPLVGAVLVVSLSIPGAAVAHRQSYSFVWANDASASAYAPAASYRYNDSGSLVSIVQVGTALYRVHFFGLSDVTEASGNVQVTAYGNVPASCRVTDFELDDAWVACSDAGGLPSESRFSLLHAKREAHADEVAYTRIREPTSPAYSPAAEDTLNPSGGGADVTRVSTGIYAVAFPGMAGVGSNGGHVQVTAAGSSFARCKVASWGADTVFVRCHDAAGNLADAEFTLLFMKPEAGREGLAYAWVDDPYSATSTPAIGYRYNSGGGAISVTRLGTGDHRVDFVGMASQGANGGNAQVTAYGTSNEWCLVDSWGPDQVRVRCFDPAGAPVDTPFTVALHRTPRLPFPSQYAFALASQSLLSGYDAPSSTSWNAGGGPVHLSRSSTGTYQVEWPGMDEVGIDLGIVLVSAYDSGDGYCKIASWSSSGADVRCFDATGSLSDRAYNVLYLKPDEGTPGVAYAWANQPTTTLYTAPAAYSYNPTGGDIQIERLAEGVYIVTFEGYGATIPDEGHAQVTAYGTSSDYCIVNSFSNYPSDDIVSVECRDAAGARRDSRFTVVYLKPDAKRDGLAYGAFFGGTTPPSGYAYNPEGGTVARTLVSPGLYRVDLEGFDARGLPGHLGHLQVSSFYAGDSNLCKGASLGSSPLVQCMDASGAPVADDFTILMLRPTTAVPEPAGMASLCLGVLALAGLARGRDRPASRGLSPRVPGRSATASRRGSRASRPGSRRGPSRRRR
jgi:hypothetical protein